MGNQVIPETEWFDKFETGKDNECWRKTDVYENAELEELLEEDSCQT